MGQEVNVQNNDVVEIDLVELFLALKKKLVVIILCAIIGAGAAGGYAFFLATPIYQSTSKLYIKTQSTSITSLADIQVGSSLAYDYQEMIVSRTFLYELITNLNLDYSVKELGKMISVDNPSNTRILAISVKSSDPEEAKAIANELANISKKNISEIMSTDDPVFFEKAIKASKPIEPEKKKLIAIGFILGAFLAAAIVTINHIMNDKISDSEDVERLLKLPVLAMIPIDDSETDKKAEVKKSRKKNSSR